MPVEGGSIANSVHNLVTNEGFFVTCKPIVIYKCETTY